LALIGLIYPNHQTLANEVSHETFVFKIDPELNKPKYVLSPLPFNPVPLQQGSIPKMETRKPTPAPKTRVPSGRDCSCVIWVKAQIGFTRSIGFARNWPINSHSPSVGAVIITNESRAGHVGLVREVTETTITIEEANYSHCKVTTRTIPINSSVIKGYYIP
jgi:hypothetical protein